MFKWYLRYRQSLHQIRGTTRRAKKEMRRIAREDQRLKAREFLPPTPLARAAQRSEHAASLAGSIVAIATAVETLARMWRERSTPQPAPTPLQAGGEDKIPVF